MIEIIRISKKPMTFINDKPTPPAVLTKQRGSIVIKTDSLRINLSRMDIARFVRNRIIDVGFSGRHVCRRSSIIGGIERDKFIWKLSSEDYLSLPLIL